MNYDRESRTPSVDLVMHVVLGFSFVLCSGVLAGWPLVSAIFL